MPVIDVNLKDFLDLLRAETTIDEIEEAMPLMGVAWENRTEDGFAIEVFPNRPDMLSIEGLARAYAAFTGLNPGLRRYEAKESNYSTVIERKVETVRPYFASAVIKKIEFDDALIRSIMQMQEKLHVTHGRKRRKVSIGLHNLDPIKFPITYTTRPPDFSFRPLGERREMTQAQILSRLSKGVEYAWILEEKDEYPILMDAKEMVLSMPPIINSEHTRIDEATEDIFVDITATEPKAMNEILNILSTTFADRGADIFTVKNCYYDVTETTPNFKPRNMELDNTYVNKMLGLELNIGETAGYLKRMGYGAKSSASNSDETGILSVQIPCFRTDVMHPIDLVEDVAIAYGYNNFTPEIPEISSIVGEDPLEVFCRHLRNFLVGFGFQETMTFMMTNKMNLFERMGLADEPVAETENPKTEEYTVIRNRLLPSLLGVLSINKHHPYPQNLFEVADVILLDEREEQGARNAKRLAVAICHAKANFSEVKAVMNSILGNLQLAKVDVIADGFNCYIDGRRLVAKVEERPICWTGELRPDVLENWGLEMPVAGLEIDVDLLFELTRSMED